MDLIRLALERAGSVDDAAQVIVSLLERHGQGGSASFEHPGFSYDNSFLLADAESALVLETAGRSWATETVAGAGRSMSNELTIDGFAAAHRDRARSRVAQGSVRRRRTQTAACRATGPADLAAALRSHGDGAAPRYSLLNGAMSAPCMHAGGLVASSQTTSSWVSDLRGAPRHWSTTTAAPCTSLFKPVSIDEPVDLGSTPSNLADHGTLWWRHERLHRAVMADPLSIGARYRRERDCVERLWWTDPPPSAAAFRTGDRLERRWLEDVSAASTADVRPAGVRRAWRRADRQAALS